MTLMLPHRGHRVARAPPGGEVLVTGVSPDRSGVLAVLVWDIASGRIRHRLLQPSGSVTFLEMSPCGAKVITAGWDRDSVFVWSLEDGRLEREVATSIAWSSVLSVSSGGHQVIVSSPGKVSISSGVTGRLRHQISVGEAFAPSAFFVASGRLVVFTPTEAVDSGDGMQTLSVSPPLALLAWKPRLPGPLGLERSRCSVRVRDILRGQSLPAMGVQAWCMRRPRVFTCLQPLGG